MQDHWHLPAGTIFRSDKGSQYTADKTMAEVASYGWYQSFSRVGKPGDNARNESLSSILKKEVVHWHFYSIREQACQAIFEYTKVFYNRQQQGYLLTTKGDVIHYGFTERFIAGLNARYHIKEIAFGRWGAV